MKAVMQTLLILVLVSLGLAGCGQKGDLFLPATKTPVATPIEPVAEPAPPATKQPELTQSEQQPAAETTASTDATQQAQPSKSNKQR